MPRTMDGFLVLQEDGRYSVRFAGTTEATGLTEEAARTLLLGLADGRDLWRFTGQTYVPLVLDGP